MLKTEKTNCSKCQANLEKCETIWAAMGFLFCSSSCGEQHFGSKQTFEELAEEINPRDIGIGGEQK